MQRAMGILLFLPVPVVLLLFTRAPLGLGPSVALGLALMLSHRLYARPYALARADSRCLWCAAEAGDGPRLAIDEPPATTSWRACSPIHAERVARVLAWAGRHAVWLRLGILGTLLVFLLATLLAGRWPDVSAADRVAFFRLGIASSVLPLSLFAPLSHGAVPGRLRPPFPVHIQALIGTWAVLWLFRLIGLAWLVLGIRHVAERLQ